MTSHSSADPGSAQPTFRQVLASRRMCRDFLAEEPDPELLDRILASAFRGPTAGNTCGLELLVLQGSDVDRYWDVTLGDRRGQFRWQGLLRAPLLIIPVVDPSAYVSRYGETDKRSSGLGDSVDAWGVPYWFVDGGAAVMAMLLTVEASGLGALFFGQFEHEANVTEEFDIPSGRRSLGTLALGYPTPTGREPSQSARRGRPDPAGLVHRGRW